MKHAPIVKRSLLDELYADAPKPRERFLWPVALGHSATITYRKENDNGR